MAYYTYDSTTNFLFYNIYVRAGSRDLIKMGFLVTPATPAHTNRLWAWPYFLNDIIMSQSQTQCNTHNYTLILEGKGGVHTPMQNPPLHGFSPVCAYQKNSTVKRSYMVFEKN